MCMNHEGKIVIGQQNYRIRLLLMVNDILGGGVERVANAHGRIFACNPNFEVALVLCKSRPDYFHEMRQYIIQDFRNGSKISGVLNPNFNKAYMQEILDDFRPDIVHIHAYIQFGIGAMQALLEYKNKNECYVVMTHHTYSYLCPNDSFFNYRTNRICERCVKCRKIQLLFHNCYGSFFGSLGKYLQKRGFQKIFQKGLIDSHITPSNFLRNKLLRKEPNMNVTTIQNPCFEYIAEEIPQKQSGKIVYFGRISREKNVLAAAETVIHYSYNINLVIIGNGPDEQRLKNFLEAKKDENENKVTFINEFMSIEKLYHIISDAEYFILPSIVYETAGISIIESLNLGMTPIVSNHGSMKEIVKQAGIGYVFDPNDIKSISNAIEKAVTNRNEDEKKFNYFVRAFLEEYTENAYFSKIFEVYNAHVREQNENR